METRRFLRGLAKGLGLITLLYVFICSLTFLEVAFRLLAGKSAGEVFQVDMLHNPVVGLMIGILFTVFVQSSSTCTTVIVSLVASEVIEVKYAIPMVMGANIGTSMTSTLVSLTQVGDAKQFERAFAAATVHDCFNWIAVIVLLIVESATGYLLHLTEMIVGIQDDGMTKGKKLKIPNVLAMASDPLTDMVVQIDSSVLTCWSHGRCQGDRLLKVYCNETVKPILGSEDRCSFLFNIPGLTDATVGGILLAVALVTLTGCLVAIVRLLQSTLQGSVANVLRKYINADVPFVPFVTGYIAMVAGAVLTFLVQSSSVFTSTITPLVGIGLIDVDRMYPMVLGSNIGTTSTALLAGFASGQKAPLQIALCHLFFNLSGIVLMYPIPQTRLPLVVCKILGRTTARYRWFAIVYLIVMFFILPGVVMALSLAGTVALTVVLGVAALALVAVSLVNVVQDRAPERLPMLLRNWDFLPLAMRSLMPYDRGVMACMSACCFCCPQFVDSLRVDDEAGDVERQKVAAVAVVEGQPGEKPPSVKQGHANEALDVVDETSRYAL